MNKITTQPEPKHHGVLKVGLLFLGVVVVGAVMLVVYKGDSARQTTELVVSSSLTGQSSIPETINGITVPPEPDVIANNATLVGIDSDYDGIRDDIQRYIWLTYPKSQTRRAAANQLSIAFQNMIIGAGTPQSIQQQLSDANDCFSHSFMTEAADVTGGQRASLAKQALTTAILNTPDRVKAYAKTNSQFSPSIAYVTPYAQQASRCLINVSVPESETINGIVVPPEPVPAINNATLAGVDSNNNGVRDDVERVLAKEFGSQPKLVALMAYAKAEQTMLLIGTAESVTAMDYVYVCSNLKSEETDKITAALLNTTERSKAYRTIMASAPDIDIKAELEACR